MEFTFTDEDRKNLNILRARCKVAGLGDGIIREFRIDENGGIYAEILVPFNFFNNNISRLYHIKNIMCFISKYNCFIIIMFF